MTLDPVQSGPHDAENELYERGAELVEAAAAIRRGAAERDAARAVPALLGCVEAAIGELKAASAALADSSREPGHPAMARRVERMTRGLANLHDALDDAQAAARAARALVARVSAGLR
jgi:cyanate lyase